jgi:uncharacterized protein
MILRLILLIAFIYGIYLLLRRAAAGGAPGKSGSAPAPQEHMVSCAHCGVYLPQSDSVSAGERFYCGDAHRIAGPRQ